MSPPYYYPEKNLGDENGTATTNDSSPPVEGDDGENKSVSPRTQARIDHNMLFSDEIVPVPCEPARIKRALEERRKLDKRTKEDIEKSQAALLRREKEQKINRKIKTTKEIYTVAADFYLSPNGEKALVALALIDQQVLIYQVKQSGVKVSLVEQFSFYVKFPGKAAVSALSLDHYVTNQRPIVCLGSQLGDIAIYYVDHVNSKGQVCQKLVD